MSIPEPDPSKISLKNALLNFFKSLLKRKSSSFEESVSKLIEVHDNDESVHSEERQILSNIIRFGDKEAKDIMVPRKFIAAVPIDYTMSQLKEKFLLTNHTRMPVYKDTLDNIVGLVHIKDVFKAITNKRRLTLKDLLRDILYVPSTIKITDLLSKMRASAFHMAIILDEHGGTDGIVTIEDIVEEIVGEIHDEHDELKITPLIHHEGDSYVIDAKATINEVKQVLGEFTNHNEIDCDTFGGFILILFGKIPAVGEKVTFGSKYIIEVVEATSRKILKARVKIQA